MHKSLVHLKIVDRSNGRSEILYRRNAQAPLVGADYVEGEVTR